MYLLKILFSFFVYLQEELQAEAVAVGAILSDYQRVRVENVCSRLNLVSLAYLWRRDQTELLQEMIDCHVHAILIKVNQKFYFFNKKYILNYKFCMIYRWLLWV